MKSFSNFLLEKKMSPGPRPDETAAEKSILRNQNKKTVKTVKVGVEPVDRVSRKEAAKRWTFILVNTLRKISSNIFCIT